MKRSVNMDRKSDLQVLRVQRKICFKKRQLSLNVEDQGKGFNKEILKQIGKPNLTTKNSSGLGLFLALNTLDRIGGKLEIKNLTDGAKVVAIIPLKNL